VDDRLPELPVKIKQAAVAIRIKNHPTRYSWRYRDAVIVVIHIKRSGCLVTSIEVYDERTPSKVFKGWAGRSEIDIDTAHHQAINFMTSCYDRVGDKYLYLIKCRKALEQEK